MTTHSRKFIISFTKTLKKKGPGTFLARARRHFVKAKRGVGSDLSSKVDKIVYGI